MKDKAWPVFCWREIGNYVVGNLRYVFIFLFLTAEVAGARAQQISHFAVGANLDQSAKDGRAGGDARAGSITGRIIGDDGKAVADAEVSISPLASSLSVPGSANVQADGRFRIDNLKPGLYQIWASAPGYVSGPDTDESDEARYYRPGDFVSITLAKGGVITGTVTDAGGEPLVAAHVRALRVRDANHRKHYGLKFGPQVWTDDRGIYRFYGLPAGSYLVSVGESNSYGYLPVATTDGAPTYYPSETYETATEVTVRSGQEVSGIDIRYRGEAGHAISGTLVGAVRPGIRTRYIAAISVILANARSKIAQYQTNVFEREGQFAFSLGNIPDGEYEIMARRWSREEDMAASPPRHISVHGGDVTGIRLTLALLGSVSGRVVLETGHQLQSGVKCTGTGRLTPQEVGIKARLDMKNKEDWAGWFRPFNGENAPDEKGDFTLHNVSSGHYRVAVRLPIPDWYVRAITLPNSSPGRVTAGQLDDAGRKGFALRSGEHLKGLTISLAEGAAQLSGRVLAAGGTSLPEHLRVYLVPAERDSADDVLRYMEAPVKSGETFAMANIAPGRYWLLARLFGGRGMEEASPLPDFWDAETRAKLRREAEAANAAVDLPSCRHITDLKVRFAPPLPQAAPASHTSGGTP